MIMRDDGFGVSAPTDDGGYSSIGNGASRALPAGGWVTDPANGPWEGAGPPIKRLPSWVPPVPSIPNFVPPKGGDKSGGAPTDVQSLMDIFKSMLGSNTGNKPADSGAVVVYGDAAGGQSTGMSPVMMLLIGGAVIGGGVWAWRKYA